MKDRATLPRGSFMPFRFLILAALCLNPPPALSATFQAGVATVDISPKAFPRIIAGGFLEGRGERNADALKVRSFVLDDGHMKIAFAIVDTCMMEQALIDERIADALAVLPSLIAGHWERATQTLHAATGRR